MLHQVAVMKIVKFLESATLAGAARLVSDEAKVYTAEFGRAAYRLRFLILVRHPSGFFSTRLPGNVTGSGKSHQLSDYTGRAAGRRSVVWPTAGRGKAFHQ